MPLARTVEEAAERWMNAEWALVQYSGSSAEEMDELERAALSAFGEYRRLAPGSATPYRHAVDIRHLLPAWNKGGIKNGE